MACPIGRGTHILASTSDVPGGDRAGGHGLLEQAPEHEPAAGRGSSVEPVGELLEVALQIARVDRALVGAQQPALEQRRNAVHPRQDDVGGVAAAGLNVLGARVVTPCSGSVA